MQGRCTNAYYAAIVVTADIWYDRRLPCRLDVSVAAGTRATLQQLAAVGNIKTLAADGNSQLWSVQVLGGSNPAVAPVMPQVCRQDPVKRRCVTSPRYRFRVHMRYGRGRTRSTPFWGDSKKACSTSRIVEVATAEKSAAVSTVGFSMGYPLCD